MVSPEPNPVSVAPNPQITIPSAFEEMRAQVLIQRFICAWFGELARDLGANPPAIGTAVFDAADPSEGAAAYLSARSAELKQIVSRSAEKIVLVEDGLKSGTMEARSIATEALADFDRTSLLPLKAEIQSEIFSALSLLDQYGKLNPMVARGDLDTLREQLISSGATDRVQRAVESLVDSSILPAKKVPAAVSTSTSAESPIQQPEVEVAKPPTNLDAGQQLIAAALKATSQDLIDIGLRNPLLHHRVSSSKGVVIEGERSELVLAKLVRERGAMTFEAAPTPVGATQDQGPAQPEDAATRNQRHSDNVLQTSHKSVELQRRLVLTDRQAKLHLEEQGANTLFLSLGMLYWKDTETGEQHKAPLVMVPVTLSRPGVTGRYRLSHSGDELEDNLPLRARLREEFGIELPVLPELEDLRLSEYFTKIQEAIRTQPEFRVAEDEIQLGFLSFARQLMFRDLNPDVWPDDRKPWDHPIVSALLGRGFVPKAPVLPEGTSVDRASIANSVPHILDCDASQFRALLEVQAGRSLVIKGPPGTGKSQTITNIIANAVARNVPVLFVSAKAAALHVVQEMLERRGLGSLVLELHSDKAKKRELVADFKNTISLGEPKVSAAADLQARLLAAREALNRHHQVVCAPIGRSGLRVDQVVEEIVCLGLKGKGRRSAFEEPLAAMDQATFGDVLQAAVGIEAALSDLGTSARSALLGIRRSSATTFDEQEFQEKSARCAMLAEAFHRQVTLTFQGLGLSPDNSYAQIRIVLGSIDHLLLAPDLGLDFLSVPLRNAAWGMAASAVSGLIAPGISYREARKKLAAVVKDSAWDQDLSALENQLLTFQRRGTFGKLFHLGEFFKARRAVTELCQQKFTGDQAKRIELVADIRQGQADRAKLEKNAAILKSLYGEQLWRGVDSDWSKLQQIATWVGELHRLAKSQLEFSKIQEIAQQPDKLQKLRDCLEGLRQSEREYTEALSNLQAWLEYDQSLVKETFEAASIPEQVRRIRTWSEYAVKLDEFSAYNRVVRRLEGLGLLGLGRTLEGWLETETCLVESLRFSRARRLLEHARQEHPELAEFSRVMHEQLAKQFNEDDRANLTKAIEAIARDAWSGIPRLHVGGGQVGLLKAELEKSSRFRPVRELLREAGNAVQAVKPIFMMSPQSVARYLDPRSPIRFGLVVFDEASQLRPAEVLGAILRADQVVVTGDTEQLPPTSFWESTLTEGLGFGADSQTASLESALDLFIAKSASTVMLSSAYRFRQPSLIALSNRLHYQGKLRIFPSPYVDEEHHGLVYRSVPNTIYDRGRSSTNIEEARAVARAVIDHAKRTPDQSLGVVALSTQQAEAITLELEVLRTQDPSTEAFFASNASEAFFVKNLENVQGDERDVIMVSIGYARDQEGRLPMNFGPLNQAGGERRLNVLMTRAKHRCEIFTAIDPAELRIEGKAKGVENLRAFLSYAKERMVQIDADRAAPPRNETAFQAHLRAALESRGLKVKTNIGHANCTIDLAIVHPSDPSRYLLGVVTDLDPNAQHESARDRERIVPVMLRNLGWNVFRLWAMEYVSDPQGVIERIVKTVEQAAATEPATVANKANNSAPETFVHRRAEVSNLAEAGGQAYVEAQLKVSRPAGVPLYTLPLENFTKWITKVVEVESPVHREEVDRRIRNAGDVDQSQSLADALAGGLRLALDRGLILQRGDFLYSKLDQPVRVRDRGALRSTASRKIDVVAPEEVEAAILFVVKHAFGIKPEELPDAVRWCLGVTTISDARKGMIIMQAETLREAGLIKQKGAFLH